ncbi:MAG: galactokinase [Acidobacteria bacterium]|jgi:galactokinase|nr:galactokinase [Acidobacteriota bacterium]
MTDSSGIDPELVERARDRFTQAFGAEPSPKIAVAPGRVNLIGEHTDYNDGFVLPMAIGRSIVLVFRPRGDRALRGCSVAYDETKELDLDALAPPGGSDWLSYVAGVAWAFATEGLVVPGLDVVVDGDVPLGAGLSSSAALEMATARALADAAALEWDPVRMARLGQKAENQYVGMNCGIMDQFASAVSRAGHALLLDCRSLDTRPVPLPEEAAVVVMDTGARRSLAGSAYNDRRAACERVVAHLRGLDPGVRALRDVTLELLEDAKDDLDPTDLMRARHVVPENARPVHMADALQVGRLEQAGRLMNDSHSSLRDLYEVSCEELDLITDIARGQASCFGARMTGAGFGGCAVALVKAAETGPFCDAVLSAYEEKIDLPAALYPCRPMAGARLLD